MLLFSIACSLFNVVCLRVVTGGVLPEKQVIEFRRSGIFRSYGAVKK